MSLIYRIITFYLSIFCMLHIPVHAFSKPITIMIDPLGDAAHIGRRIEDSFERSITLQWAQALKQAIEQKNLSHSVVITRAAHDTVAPLQNAQYANRLHVDLYISLSCFQSSDTASLNVYRYSSGNDTAINPNALVFIAYTQAYRLHGSTSHALNEYIVDYCIEEPTNLGFAINGPYAFPFKPLVGITSPHIAFEAGLVGKNDWKALIESLAQAITLACHKYAGALS